MFFLSPGLKKEPETNINHIPFQILKDKQPDNGIQGLKITVYKSRACGPTDRLEKVWPIPRRI